MARRRPHPPELHPNSIVSKLGVQSKTYVLMFALSAVVQLFVWRYDTTLAVSTAGNSAPVEVSSNTRVKIAIPVIFNSTRQCSMLISRYFLDSNGTYFDLMATRFVSATGLIEIERASPTSLRFVVTIPAEAAAGSGVIVTQVSSMCNPLQIVWPTDIDIRTRVRVVVG